MCTDGIWVGESITEEDGLSSYASPRNGEPVELEGDGGPEVVETIAVYAIFPSLLASRGSVGVAGETASMSDKLLGHTLAMRFKLNISNYILGRNVNSSFHPIGTIVGQARAMHNCAKLRHDKHQKDSKKAYLDVDVSERRRRAFHQDMAL